MIEKSPAQKMFVKPGHRVAVVGAPSGLVTALGLPEGASLARAPDERCDMVALFVTTSDQLSSSLPPLLEVMGEGAALWIAYPKRSSGVETDLTRDKGWGAAEQAGLEPVSQIAVDAVWSALRFKKASTTSRRRPAPSAGSPATRSSSAAPAETPAELERALSTAPSARALFDRLAPSHRREYARWVGEAKRAETREGRAVRAVAMLLEGKRNP